MAILDSSIYDILGDTTGRAGSGGSGIGPLKDATYGTANLVSKNGSDSSGGLMSTLLGNQGILGTGAGLASALTQIMALPSAIELAETQQDALKQNLAFAKQEQQRRNSNIGGFNSFNHNASTASTPSASKSAFL